MSYHLTPREKEIMNLTAQGATRFEIAKTLDISPETVKSHTINIRLRLAAVNMNHAIALSMSHGLIQII